MSYWLARVRVLHAEGISLGEMVQIERHGIGKGRRDFLEHAREIPGERSALVLMQEPLGEKESDQFSFGKLRQRDLVRRIGVIVAIAVPIILQRCMESVTKVVKGHDGR